MYQPRGGIVLASTNSKASNTNTIQATSDNIEALRDKICVYIGPCKFCPDFGLIIFANDDFIEPGHRRYVHLVDEKPGLVGMATAFYRKRNAICSNLLELSAYKTPATQ
jgi:hypothetical protein